MFATRTEQTTQTTGTGTVDLIPALTGRSNFSDTIGNGNACYYIIQTSDESQWEEGWGVVTAGSPDQLTRNTVVASSNGNTLVNFPSGTKTVFIGDNADTIRFGHVGQLPTTGGTATALTVAYAPPLRHLRAGMVFRFISAFMASGSATTLAINGLPAMTLRAADGTSAPVQDQDFVNGSVVTVIYDGSIFRIIHGGPSVASRQYVDEQVDDLDAAVTAALALLAPKASPELTGDIYINGSARQVRIDPALLNLDCSLGNFFYKSVGSAVAFTFSNIPSGVFIFSLMVSLSAGSITWPGTVHWANGLAPVLTTGRVHVFTFVTLNGGSTVFGSSLLHLV